jgi:condensin complex subunit 3
MLAGTIQDLDLLKQIVLAYFDPETQGNPSLRQALTYFLPVYCHSRRRNAEAMAKIAVPVLHALAERAEDLDEEEEMVGLALVAAQMCDWTDPRKTVPGVDGVIKVEEGETDGHLVLAEELLEKILTPGCSSEFSRLLSLLTRLIKDIEEERKTYFSLLGKLHLGPTASAETLQTLFDLANEAFEGKVAAEALARNTLTKFQNALTKLLAAAGSAPGSKDASVTEDAPVETTEVPPEATPPEVTEVDATVVAAEEDEDEDEDEDMTMMTKFTGVPDAEGTVFSDYDEEEDESEGTVVDDKVRVKKEKGVVQDESLLESLLEDDETDI